MASDYSEFTREQLLERIKTLEFQVKQNHAKKNNKQEEQEKDELKHKPTRQERKGNKKREFDMSKYTKRKVAFRIAYLGWNYMGFASQGDEDKLPTVEGRIFQALNECKLIETIDEASDYTRCGRTDKGVSGMGQVIALYVRSKKLATDPSPDLLPPSQEFPYIDTLNRMLPDDIRVLAWAPAFEDFSARFHCQSRTYKYYFSRGKMDIEKMREACRNYEGDHDFRNFCKLDPTKNVLSYNRIMTSMTIEPVPYTKTADIGDGTEFYEVTLTGTAFLWHQVRYMMSVLFLVGQGLEDPSVITQLLDVEKVPAKPEFPMASDLPLVLYDCKFSNLDWTYTSNADRYQPFPPSLRTYQQFGSIWTEQMVRAITCQAYFSKVGTFPIMAADNTYTTILDMVKARGITTHTGASTIQLGGGKETRLGNYKPLLQRPRGDSDQVKKVKYEARKKRKLDS
jgi:tRNA pseudouridine38/39 synthase